MADIRKTFTTLSAAALAGTALSAITAAPASAQPEEIMKPDGSWTAISGTVVTSGLDAFTVSTGEGVVTVEMDDFDFDADAAPIDAGDEVTVYGRVDADFYEARTIEAGTVYEADTGTFHYASAADEDRAMYALPAATWTEQSVTLTGEVQSVTGREFVLDSVAGYPVEVDTASMALDPTDDDGMVQIDEGDTVSVTGELDDDLFDNTELSANSIVELNDASIVMDMN